MKFIVMLEERGIEDLDQLNEQGSNSVENVLKMDQLMMAMERLLIRRFNQQ